LRWSLTLIILVVCCWCARVSFAEENLTLQVDLSSAKERTVAPKSLLSSVFVVTNPVKKKQNITLEASLPNGWQLISSIGPLELAPKERRSVSLTVSIPSWALAGNGYQICLIARPQAHPEQSSQACVDIEILPHAQLQIRGPEAESQAYPGQSINYAFKITNLGNAKDKIKITASSAHKEKVDLSSEIVELEIGGQAQIIASVHVPLQVSAGTKHVLTVRATSLTDKNVFAETNVYTPLIERRTARSEGFYRLLPSQAIFHLSGLGTGDTLSPQVEFYTGGNLTENYRMNFAYQGPYYKNRENFQGLSEEIYSLDYGNNLWNLSLGDTAVNLSELTALSLFGRGQKFTLQKNPLSATVFNLQKKQAGFTEDVIGGKITGKIGQVSEIGVNYFSSKENKTDATATRQAEEKKIASAVLVSRFKTFSIEGEYAGSSFNVGNTKSSDEAWRAGYSLKKEKLFATGEFVNAGPNYPGLRKDYLGYRNYVAYRFFRPLWVWGYETKYHNNVKSDPAKARDNTERIEFGGSFTAKNLPYVSFSYQDNKTKSEEDFAATADTKEKNYSLKTNKTFGQLSLDLESKFSQKKDDITSVDSDTREYTGRLYRHWKRLNGWVGYTYNVEEDKITQAKTTLHRKEAGLLFQPISNLSTAVTFTQEATHGQKASDILNLSVNYSFTEDYAFSLDGEMRNDSNAPQRREWKFWLTLKAWFDMLLPVKMRGALEVHVFVDENNNGLYEPREPGAGQIVLLLEANKGTTHKNGRYRFASLVPGQYVLDIDISSLPVEFAPRIKLPRSINITRGKLLKLEIPLVRVGRISGMVYEDTNKNGQRDAEEKPRPLIRIVLISESTISRDTFTDSEGKYSFASVIPQKYQLRLDQDWLPARYMITTEPSYSIELKPKEHLSGLDFGIVEKEKQIIKTYTAPEIQVIKPKKKQAVAINLAFYSAATVFLAYLVYRWMRKK